MGRFGCLIVRDSLWVVGGVACPARVAVWFLFRCIVGEGNPLMGGLASRLIRWGCRCVLPFFWYVDLMIFRE